MRRSERRRAPRSISDWVARYRYNPNSEWRSCRVVNVSVDDAAVELDDVLRHEPVTGRFYLQISSVAGDEVGVTIRADPRHHVRSADGRPIAGIEFDTLRSEERDLLRLLVALRMSVRRDAG